MIQNIHLFFSTCQWSTLPYRCVKIRIVIGDNPHLWGLADAARLAWGLWVKRLSQHPIARRQQGSGRVGITTLGNGCQHGIRGSQAPNDWRGTVLLIQCRFDQPGTDQVILFTRSSSSSSCSIMSVRIVRMWHHAAGGGRGLRQTKHGATRTVWQTGHAWGQALAQVVVTTRRGWRQFTAHVNRR